MADANRTFSFGYPQANIWEPLLVDANGRPGANYYEIDPTPEMKDDFNPRARNIWTNVVPQMLSLTNPGGIGDGRRYFSLVQ